MISKFFTVRYNFYMAITNEIQFATPHTILMFVFEYKFVSTHTREVDKNDKIFVNNFTQK